MIQVLPLFSLAPLGHQSCFPALAWKAWYAWLRSAMPCNWCSQCAVMSENESSGRAWIKPLPAGLLWMLLPWRVSSCLLNSVSRTHESLCSRPSVSFKIAFRSLVRDKTRNTRHRLEQCRFCEALQGSVFLFHDTFAAGQHRSFIERGGTASHHHFSRCLFYPSTPSNPADKLTSFAMNTPPAISNTNLASANTAGG